MFGFLSLLSWPKMLKTLAVVSVIGTIGGTLYIGYKYITNIQEENIRLAVEKAKLESDVEKLRSGIIDQQKAIEQLQEDNKKIAEILETTNQQFQESREMINKLRDRLSRHELGYLAYNKPKLVEKIINNATKDAFRCIEIAAGSPLTEQEKTASVPSEFNSECPELANPLYKKYEELQKNK